jgi:hypothetical protein
MLSVTADTVASLVNSPPAHLAAGGVLAGLIWKLFDRVDAVLNDDTKTEVALWLLHQEGRGENVRRWPETFAKVFDRVFGSNHWSLKCFGRSVLASYSVLLIIYAVSAIIPRPFHQVPLGSTLMHLAGWGFVGSVLPDYLSLLQTRYFLRLMSRVRPVVQFVFLVADLVFTFAFGVIASQTVVSLYIVSHADEMNWTGTRSVVQLTLDMCKLLFTAPAVFFEQVGMGYDLLYLCAPFFASLWLWLYVAGGVAIRALRRLGVAFSWFNRRFEIEKKPLQSIGFVAGVLVAIIYWAAVVVTSLY